MATATMEVGTPRPGTQEISVSTSSWIFSQVANQQARETKRKIVSRTYYRMAANKKVIDAIGALEKSCSFSGEIPQADFQLLKKAIETFNVQIRVFDSVTMSDLVNMRMKAQLELADDSEKTPIKKTELTDWISEITGEIRRINSTRIPGVPSQQAQIMRSSAMTLCNVLSPETAWRKFISLEKLTSAIRIDLIAFLTCESRKDDRAEVVKQIKDSIIHKTRQ
jgi:hypothetical protein